MEYIQGKHRWSVKGDVALPCATQNELDENDAKELVKTEPLCNGGSEYADESGRIKVFMTPEYFFVRAKLPMQEAWQHRDLK